jgi:hypothetical protein
MKSVLYVQVPIVLIYAACLLQKEKNKDLLTSMNRLTRGIVGKAAKDFFPSFLL